MPFKSLNHLFVFFEQIIDVLLIQPLDYPRWCMQFNTALGIKLCISFLRLHFCDIRNSIGFYSWFIRNPCLMFQSFIWFLCAVFCENVIILLSLLVRVTKNVSFVNHPLFTGTGPLEYMIFVLPICISWRHVMSVSNHA